MTKYVIYRRLSKEDKSRNQHGFESQMEDIQQFLANQQDAEVIGDFKEFISGTSDHKPEQEKALALCKETGAQLLVAKVDRFSRRVSQIALLLESKIELRVAVMPNASTFELHIYAALSQQEREFISDRVVKGLKAARAAGKLIGAASPKHKATFQANKDKHVKTFQKEASRKQLMPVVNAVKDMLCFSKGSMKLDDIAIHLNDKGLRTATGKEWKKANVSLLIKEYAIKQELGLS